MEQSKRAEKWAYRILPVMAAACIVSSWLLGAALAEPTGRGSVVRCSVETNRSILTAGESQKVVAKVTLTAAKPPATRDRPPVNLCIVLDRSGSMGGDKIVKAREAAIEAVKRLNSKDVFSLVAYNHSILTVVPAAHVKDIETITTKIKGIESCGNTALFGGVTQGATEIRKHVEDKYVHRIILLSDGLANVGPSTPEELGRLGASLLKEGISVTTVGVGMDYNEDLMTKLAQKSDGNSYFVESSKDLSGIFAAELGDVLNIAAKNVRLVVECPDDVRPVSIIGREGRIHGQKVELTLNQLYGGQEKYALLELDVSGISPNKSLEVAAANVRFDDPLAGRSKTVKGVAVIKFSHDKVEVAKSVNASVTTAYEMTLSALAQEKAIILADRGNTREAIEALKKSASRLRSVGEQYGDRNALKKADELTAGAQGIESRGYVQQIRKGLRTDSYQYMQQQSYPQKFQLVHPAQSSVRQHDFRLAPQSLQHQESIRIMQQQQQQRSIQPVRPERDLRLIDGR